MHSEIIGLNGRPMVPLRCELCGEQVGLREDDYAPDPAKVIVRCYGCATTEEAEAITRAGAGS